MLKKNIEFGNALKISSWRKIAIGTWVDAGDPSVYGLLEVDAAPALRYLEEQNRNSENKLTLTHFVGKAMAETIHRHPEINCMLRWGRIYPRMNVDVFFHVASDKTGKDLTGLTIRNAASKSIQEIAAEMVSRVSRIRSQGDPDYKQMKSSMSLVPGMFAKWLMNFTSFLMYSLNIWSPILGVPRDPFGSAMVTSIGSLGLEIGFVPLVPYSRIPLLIAVGALAEKPVVRNGQVEVGKILPLCATFDHRLIDGAHASHMVRTVKQIFANPQIELSAHK